MFLVLRVNYLVNYVKYKVKIKEMVQNNFGMAAIIWAILSLVRLS